jgi:hypothetical protein
MRGAIDAVVAQVRAGGAIGIGRKQLQSIPR